MSARYHAPAVAYGFERPRWAASTLLLAWLVLLAALLSWCHAAQWQGRGLFMAPLALCLAAWLLYRQWADWPQGCLQWNGEHWLLVLASEPRLSTQPMRLKIGLDGGNWLWLGVSSLFAPESRPVKRYLLWIWIAQSHSPAQWGDMRRAVYSSAVPLAEQG